MLLSFRGDFVWSQQYIPDQKRILANHFGVGIDDVEVASFEEDTERNTDLIIRRTVGDLRIGLRVRKEDDFEKYPDQFTIRYGRSHCDTEWQKFLDGWGDYFLYGFGRDHTTEIFSWKLVDLDRLRLYVKSKDRRYPPGILQQNPDRSSTFRVFWDDYVPSGVIVASYSELAEAA